MGNSISHGKEEVGRPAVLLSIRPKWCELIFTNRKQLEIRTTAIPEGSTVYVYQTKRQWGYKLLPHLSCCQGKVIGKFVCDKVEQYGEKEPAAVFGQVMQQSKVSATELSNYGKKNGFVYGWHITCPVLFDTPLELSTFRRLTKKEGHALHINRAPQSWCYVEKLSI